MQKLATKFDMDGVCVNLLGPWLEELMKRHRAADGSPLHVTMEDITEFKMEKTAKLAHLSRNQILDVLKTPGYFEALPAVAGAVETLKRLAYDGHSIKLLTALPGTGPYADEVRKNKLAWAMKNLSFLRPDDVLFSEAEDKANYPADVFVDDRADTLVSYKTKNPDALVMGISYPYNHNAPGLGELGIGLALDYKKTVDAWDTIEQRIHQRALGHRST